jgi:hypothetical protein
MSKHVDWDQFYQAPMRGKRGKYDSAKELFQKGREQMLHQEQVTVLLRKMEPFLKKALFDHMVGRKAITVIHPFAYFTEVFEKSQSENDMGRFREIAKEIPAGTKLTFHRIDKTLKQWIFKSESGAEIEIYDAPTVMFGRNPTRNPAWYGLLHNTNIFEEVRAALGKGDQPSQEEE